MRVIIGGVIASALAAGAVWFAVAGATQAGYPGGPYQIYIFDSREGHSIYAFAVGQRATAARAEACSGRLLDDALRIVADFRDRAATENDELNVVWISGQGSSVSLGRCDAAEDEDKEGGHTDSLVVVRDASERQARRLIREAPLSAAEREVMIGALELNGSSPGRR
jgi:hypothetical protein